MRLRNRGWTRAAAAAAGVLLASCLGPGAGAPVRVGGSPALAPLTEALAGSWSAEPRDARLVLESSATGPGLEQLCAGELDLAQASRPIRPEETKRCAERGVDFVEFMVAYGAVVVVVHPDNDWARELDIDELRRVLEPAAEGVVDSWDDVRAGWPARPLRVVGPGPGSGTYDYLTEAVLGEGGASRGDLAAEPDHDLVARRVAGDPDALGFLCLAAYVRHRGAVRAVAIDGGEGGAQLPDPEALRADRYRPLGRPLLLYVARGSLARPEVAGLVRHLLAGASEAAPSVGLVALPEPVYAAGIQRLERRLAGSVFEGGARVGLARSTLLELDLEQLMDVEVP